MWTQEVKPLRKGTVEPLPSTRTPPADAVHDKKQTFFRTVSRFRDELERTVSNGVSRPVSAGLDAMLDSSNNQGAFGPGGINEVRQPCSPEGGRTTRWHAR